MATLQAALDALKKAVSNAKTSKEVKATFARVSSSLILLKSSSPSVNTKNSLASTFRSPFVPLYTALPSQALDLSLALFIAISNDKIAKLAPADEVGRSSWEVVQTAIFSGILDYMEESENNESKETVAAAFYPTICSTFFPISESSSATIIGASLRSMAYMVLYESADHHSGNQRKLRDPKILGGKRIGTILYQTTDFLAVETLFTLFARLLPSVNSGDSGRAKRSKFIQEVFLQPSFECGQKIVRVLEEVSKSAWEDTVAILMDILAKENIAFPQPFALDEIRVCGTVFPQPTSSDRLYLDTTCFFGNIVDDVKSDSYESLQVRYTDVVSIDFTSGSSVIQVTVNLSAPAIVAEAPMKTSGALTAMFDIHAEDINRFIEALRRRGLNVRISGQRKRAKNSFPSISLNMTHGEGPSLSREEQVKDVRRAYGLDQSSDPYGPAEAVEVFDSDRLATASNGLPGWATTLGSPSSTETKMMVNKTTNPSVHPLRHTGTQIARGAVFGKQDEELSHIEDNELPEVASIKCDSRPIRSNGDKRSGITTITSPDSKDRKVSDVDIDKPITLRVPRGTASVKKKAVIDFETKDNDKVPKVAVSMQSSLQVGRRTRASTALADRLKIVATTATKTSISRMDDAKQAKEPGRAASTSQILAIVPAQALSNKALLGSPTVTSLVSDGSLPLPIAQLAQEMQPAGQSKYSLVVSAAEDTFPDLYVSDYIPQTIPDSFDTVAKLATHIAPGGRAASMKTKRNDAPQGSPALIKDSRKRKEGAEATNFDVSGVENRPVKRLRGQLQAPGIVSRSASPEKKSASNMIQKKAARFTFTAKRYGRKERLSSPEPSVVTGIDFDELPGSAALDKPDVLSPVQNIRLTREAVRKASTLPAGMGKTRALAMRRKDEKVGRPLAAGKKGTKHQSTQALDIDNIVITPNEAIDPPENKRVTRSNLKKTNSGRKDGPAKANSNFADLGDSDDAVEATVTKLKKAKKAPWEVPSFMESATEAAVIQSQLVDINPIQIDHDEDAENVIMEYSVPTKVDPFSKESAYVSTPQKDVVMIDLTEESPMKNKKLHIPRVVDESDFENVDVQSMPRLIPEEISPITRPVAPTGSRHSVTFAPIVNHRSLSPAAYSRDRLAFSSPDNTTMHSPVKHTVKSDLKRNESSDQYYDQISPKRYAGTRRDAELQDIVDVLNNIQNEIVRNLSNKFDGVKKDVRVGRDRILREATSDLHEMRGDGVRHFNALVDLERDYAAHRRKNIQGWEDAKEINEEICQLIGNTVKDHDRNSVSKKFPKLLFSNPIPASLRSK